MNLNSALQRLSSDAEAAVEGDSVRCAVANFRWEHGVSDARIAEYNAYIGDVVTQRAWKAEHKSYVNSYVQVPKDFPRSAECFMAIGAHAHLSDALDNTPLLRLESLGHLFSNPLISDVAERFWLRFYNSQKDLRKAKLPVADESLLNEFVEQWNEQRSQARPSFVTFLNDFGGKIDEVIGSDWPHSLRDRLGLTHWPSTPGKPLPVALMCYSVEEVREARLRDHKKGAVASFARPTVLDSEMSSAFVPGPLPLGAFSYGYTLDLTMSTIPDSFTPEMLAFPIEYQAKHIKALGFISAPHALDTDRAILDARNRHVQGVQRLPGCASFGEVLL